MNVIYRTPQLMQSVNYNVEEKLLAHIRMCIRAHFWRYYQLCSAFLSDEIPDFTEHLTAGQTQNR